ncbi:hypothetical protein [Arcobacter sp. s6]|uniref:hypothetical protein n=1 Tax=Arcobacter sp. s6 TaxID=3230363 RepID=UPI0034A04AED
MEFIQNNRNFKNIVIGLLSVLVISSLFNKNNIEISLNQEKKCMSYEQLKEIQKDKIESNIIKIDRGNNE